MDLVCRDVESEQPIESLPESDPLQCVQPAVTQPYGNTAAAEQTGSNTPGEQRNFTGLLDGLYGDERQVAGRDVGEGTGGVGGIFDSTTRLIDRAIASAELRDRFDVVPDDFVGPRLPNQVTESEYAQVVNTYSDIRTGHSNFRFDNSQLTGDAAANFQQNALNDVVTMMQTPSGRGLITDTAYGNNADGSARTLTLRGISDPTAAVTRPDSQANATNGHGTSSTIEYTPGQPLLTPGAPDHYGSVRSDMVLYHEMVHSNHHRLGDRDDAVLDATTATQPADIGTHGWEYQAMGLGSHANDPYSENRYRAERRAMGEDQRHWDRYNPFP